MGAGEKKLFPNHPAWARPGTRLVMCSYLTVTSVTSEGVWTKDDHGSPRWVPLSHLGTAWEPVRGAGLRKKRKTSETGS